MVGRIVSPASGVSAGRLFALVLVAASALAAPTPQARGAAKEKDNAKQPAAPPKGLRVFYASHSLMWYVPPLLGEFADAAGIEGHKLAGLQKIGASRTLQHWNLPDAENEAKKALRKGEADVLVMSPIQFPDDGVESFVKLGLEHNPDMRFVVQLSWGGGDTDNQDFPKGAWDKVDRNKTPAQLLKLYERNIRAGEAQADAINKKYGRGKRILVLAPTAQALVLLRTKIYDRKMPGLKTQGELFVDAAHPSPPLEALNAYLHFAVLYGRTPVGLPMPRVLKEAKQENWDDRLNLALQEIAWEAATQYRYSGVAAPKAE